jgi:uncharacterized DUF497 family protein
MEDLHIGALVWDDFNEAHIWERHHLTRADVEAVCFGDAEQLYVQTTYGDRFLVVGPKRGNQLFAIVLAPKAAGAFYPVSARRASKQERRSYRAWKAGKQ